MRKPHDGLSGEQEDTAIYFLWVQHEGEITNMKPIRQLIKLNTQRCYCRLAIKSLKSSGLKKSDRRNKRTAVSKTEQEAEAQTSRRNPGTPLDSHSLGFGSRKIPKNQMLEAKLARGSDFVCNLFQRRTLSNSHFCELFRPHNCVAQIFVESLFPSIWQSALFAILEKRKRFESADLRILCGEIMRF